MKQIMKTNYKGLLSPIFFGIIPLLVLINMPGMGFKNNFLNGSVLTFLKDFWGIPLNFGLIFLTGKKLNLWKTIRNKSGFFAMVAALFGGPIGYTLYNTSFYMAGPSFGHVFTSLEPIILVLFVYFMYKRKFNLIIIGGLIITTLSVIFLVFGSSLASKEPQQIVIGALLGIGGAIAWGIESIFFEKAIKANKDSDVNVLITIKLVTALILNITIFIPTIGALNSDVTLGYKRIASTFIDNSILWRMIGGGLILFIARLLFFGSLKDIGPTISNVFYELSIIVTPILSMITYSITKEFIGYDDELLNTQFQIVFWISTIFILIGVALALIGQNKRITKKITHYFKKRN